MRMFDSKFLLYVQYARWSKYKNMGKYIIYINLTANDKVRTPNSAANDTLVTFKG